MGTKLNALVALKRSTAVQARELLRGYRAALRAGTEPTTNQKKTYKVFKTIVDGEGMYRVPTIQSDEWLLFDVIIDSDLLARIDEDVPGTVVAGAWTADGQQYRENDEIVYPLHARLIDFMPDVLVGDTWERPTELTQVHRYLGFAERDYGN